jgi:hypothetical protein
MKEKIEKESEDIEKKALKAYIGELEKEIKFLKLAVISLFVSGVLLSLSIHYPTSHIEFLLELFINSLALILSALFVYLIGSWVYFIFLGMTWVWRKKIKKS